jgi:hypothetical protein
MKWPADPVGASGLGILIGLAELTVGEIAQHDRVSGALELLLHFGGAHRGILPQGLAELLTHFGIAGHDLHVKPEEVAHLVESGLKDLDGFHFRRIGESLHEFGVSGGLHGGAVEFTLDDPQVVRNAQNAEMNVFHAFPILAIHVVPFRPYQAFLFNACYQDRISDRGGKGSPCA